MAIYDPKSMKADEFINNEEIIETIAYAEANKDNIELIDELLAKAAPKKSGSGVTCTGLTHREAAVLLACTIPEKVEQMYKLANEIKLAFYGNRIVMFAPLYLSNYCVNGCVYCPYHMKNKHIARIKLTQEQIRNEVIALQDMGHKRLAIEAGEDPVNNPIEYILESIKTIYSVHHKNGDIRRVNVNIAATTVENYRKLKEAGIGTYILFQETYNKKSYLELHPTGPKHDYDYHTEAMDRAMEGGIDDVGLGVLFGLEGYMYEFAGLLMHAEHLEAVHGVHAQALSALNAGRIHQLFGQGRHQISAVFGNQIVQLEEVAILGEGVVFIRAPRAGEHHVYAGISGHKRVDGLLVKVAPGAPDHVQLRADLIGDVLVDLLQHLRIVGDVGAVEHDRDGGQLVCHGEARHGQQHSQRQEQC